MSTYTTSCIGKRALVTGASSDIGAAIARELATVGVDLGEHDAARALWEAATASGQIDILINNAGVGYFRQFDEVSRAHDAELIQINMSSLVALARCFVDACKASTGPAYMVNIASTGAYQSVPNMSLYAASKAFVRNFSEGLHDEHRGTPLSVTSICPEGTETAFHATSGGGNYSKIANASMKSAKFVAHAAIHAMLCRKRTVIPGIFNKLSRLSVRFLTQRLASQLATFVLRKPRFVLPTREGLE